MTPNGTAIRTIRRIRDLGIRELASRIERDRGYLSRIERGQIADPGERLLRRIADVLDVPVAAINREEEH